MGLKGIARVPFQLVFLIAQFWVSLVLSLLQVWITTVCNFLPVPVSVLLPAKTQPGMEKIKNFFRSRLAKDGEKGNKLHHVPVYQREDGATIKLGCLVVRSGEENKKSYHVKNILVREDLATVHVVLTPVEVVARDRNLEHAEEEMMVNIQEIEISKERSISVGLARDGMKIVAETANTCPLHVQKFIRKHQLSVSMRKEVQRFLAGFSMSGSASLGCVNWQLDPVILGLERATDFSLEHRIERAVDVTTHMDLLMGQAWDVRTICGSEGYRVILTVEVLVDCNQELLMKMHGTLVSGRLDLSQYRAVSLRDTSNLHMLCNRRLSDITNNRTRRLSDVTPGQTLAWDEFQTQSAGNSPFRGGGSGVAGSGGVPSSVTASLDDMFASGNLLANFPAASTTTFQTLETLLSQLPQSQIVFNSPIKEVSGENTGLGTSAAGPNTSTPADALDPGDQSHHLTPHSSPSLQERQDLDQEAESLQLNTTKHADKVTFEELLPRSVEPLQRMNLSPDLEEEEEQLESESEEGSHSAKPSPNISTDLEEVEEVASPQRKSEVEMNANTQLEAEKNLQNLNVSLHEEKTRPVSQSTDSPAAPSKTSISRVQEYIQSLPSPQHFLKRDPPGEFKPPLSFPEEEANLSLCSGSHSLISRHSELSSLTGARMGSGMFYGGQQVAAAAVCPFPEDWQQTIPEVIENDEEID